ncbi:MAG: ABC transporter permease [Bacteroidales bacterium]
MKWYNYINIAYRALLRNKTRAFLTMLGIIIGIASVIAVVSLGSASTNNIRSEIASTGTNMIFISPAQQQRGGINMGAGDAKSLTASDLKALKQECRLITNVSPSVNVSGQLVAGTNNTPTSLNGVDVTFQNIRDLKVQKGIFFSESDVETAAKVCVIGKTIVDKLFPDGSDPIGKTIRFKNIPLKVIGILEERGQNGMGQDQDNVVYLPYSTVQKRMLAITHYNSIFASAVSEEESENAVTEIKSVMRRAHKLKPSDTDDFDIFTQAEMLSMVSNVTGMLTALLASVAAISLLVGGIGIMNIMYVTVTERTKEIGLRMSIGAQKQFVLMQFLSESIILSLIGGVLGILLGIIVSYLVSLFLNWEFVLNVGSIILAFGVCFIEGIFFGWYPAKKASLLDPIVALRYE